MLCRSGYGYTEYVEARSCADAGEVRTYYVRAGALLAMLHVLRACDVHYENLIANGPFPTVIDGEALLVPQRRGRQALWTRRHGRGTV